MASLAMNGATMRSPTSLSNEDSDESFVVLSSSMGPDIIDGAESAQSSLAMSTPTFIPMPEVPVTDQVSQAAGVMSMSTTSDLSSEEIHSKLESLCQENVQLKETLHQNNLAMKKQFNTLVMWQEDVMKVHQSHKEKFEETKKLIAHLRSENSELRKSTSLPVTANAVPAKPADEILAHKSKVSALEFELDTLRQANIKYKQDQAVLVQDLEGKLAEAQTAKQEEIEKITVDFQMKLATLDAERAQEINKLCLVVDSLKAQLHSAEEQLRQTQQKLVDVSARMPSEAELRESESNRKQIKEFTTELMLKNKVLLEKTDLIDNLHEQVSKLKIENETIPILKTQVDVYQADFNQEREARNKLKEEKERIADDLRHLQRRNQQLLEEVEKYQEGFVHVQSQQPPSAPSQPREPTPPMTTFTCPVCNSRYRTLRALEEHVDSCLQNSA